MHICKVCSSDGLSAKSNCAGVVDVGEGSGSFVTWRAVLGSRCTERYCVIDAWVLGCLLAAWPGFLARVWDVV